MLFRSLLACPVSFASVAKSFIAGGDEQSSWVFVNVNPAEDHMNQGKKRRTLVNTTWTCVVGPQRRLSRSIDLVRSVVRWIERIWAVRPVY